MRFHELEPVFTEFIPATLRNGKLYISIDYETAVHLCACGCDARIVTPLGTADWTLIFDGTVSLTPSIGNGQYPCRSHYMIRRNKVLWTKAMTSSAARDRQVEDIVARNQASRPGDAQPTSSVWTRLVGYLRRQMR